MCRLTINTDLLSLFFFSNFFLRSKMTRAFFFLINLVSIFGEIEYKLNVNKRLGWRELQIEDKTNNCVLIMQLPAYSIPVIGEVMRALGEKQLVINPCIDVRTRGVDKALSFARPTYSPSSVTGARTLPVYIRRFVTRERRNGDAQFLNCKFDNKHYVGVENSELAKLYFGEFLTKYRFVSNSEPMNRNYNPATYLKSLLPQLRFCRVMFNRWTEMRKIVDQLLIARERLLKQKRESRKDDMSKIGLATAVHEIESEKFVHVANEGSFNYLIVGITGVCTLKIQFDPIEHVIHDKSVHEAIERKLLSKFDPCTDFDSCNFLEIPGFQRTNRCTSDRLHTHVFYFHTDSREDAPMPSCVCIKAVAKVEKVFSLLGVKDGYGDHWDKKRFVASSLVDDDEKSLFSPLPSVHDRTKLPLKSAIILPMSKSSDEFGIDKEGVVTSPLHDMKRGSGKPRRGGVRFAN